MISFKSIAIRMLLALFIVLCAGFVMLNLPGSNWKALSVLTGSMEPSVSAGSLVLVKNVPAEKLKPGDIITYASSFGGSATITHRLVSKNNSGQFIAKGDANNSKDRPISSSRIIGKTVFSVPIVGNYSRYIRTLPGLLVLVYFPALLFIGIELRLMIKRLIDIEEKQERLKKLGEVAWEKVDLLPFRRKIGGRYDEHFLIRSNLNVYNGKIIFVITAGILAGALVAVPVRALLSSQAALTGNTISSIYNPPVNGGHPLLSKIHFNEPRGSEYEKHPTIIIYNPGIEKINMGGWTLNDSQGVLHKITGPRIKGQYQKWCHPKSTLPIKRSLKRGLKTSGGQLILKDALGNEIDAIGWGDDVTILNPSIQNVTRKSKLHRKVIYGDHIDTDSATDWEVINPPVLY